MTEYARIKLAEAMGITVEMPSTKGAAPYRVVYPNGGGQICEDPCDYLPNPFADANDDYAVLVWIRKRHPNLKWHHHMGNYQIGDYARIALEAITAHDGRDSDE